MISKLLIVALPLAAAWPGFTNIDAETLKQRGVAPTVPLPKFHSGRDNCGIGGPCLGFSEDQLVDVSAGSGHEFKAPKSTDKRGECPGLNAAANHGFLPRSGIATIPQTIEGLAAAYNMAPELAGALAAIAIAITGDPIAKTWSIGGAFPGSLLLLGQPKGLLGSHNRYEGDASIVRGDAYLHNGKVNVIEMQKWNYLYSLVGDNLSHDDAAEMAYWTAQYSQLNNPYYFSGPFTGFVAPAAHNFVVNMMSNHSAAVPGGTLDGDTLKSFFGFSGSPGNFKYNQGHERIPHNWYKRPTANLLTTVDIAADLFTDEAIYPGVLQFGGNTGKKNSFAGIDTNDLTGGLYNSNDLLHGNNLACFFLQATQQSILDFAAPLLVPLSQIISLLDQFIGPQLDALSCPELKRFDPSLFSKYPGGFRYKAEGQ